VVEQGPTSVTYGWIPFIDGAQHRIKTFRTSDGSLLDNTVLPAGIATATILVPPNTDLSATINSICEDGSEGEPTPLIRFPALILEIIVAGFTPGDQRYCTIPSANIRCEFDASGNGTMTPFKIYNSTESRDFGVRYVNNNGEKLQVSLESNGNTNQHFKFYCDGITPPVPPEGCGPAQYLRIMYESGSGLAVQAADFVLIRNPFTTFGYLQCISLTSGFKFDRMAPGPAFGNGGGDRTSDPENDFSNQLPTASPNPFSNTLDIFPNNPAAASITLQMYNLSGQKVLDQQFTGGQEQYSLSTEGLATGFYFLRIEADGEVQTLKVIKSE